MPRPRLTTDYQGRRIGARRLIEMLEEHLDRGRPTVEQADDIRTMLQELSKLAVPKTGRLNLIDRMKTIDSSRTALCWEELEEEVHVLLTGIIRRYIHTTSMNRRGIPKDVRRRLFPATRLLPPRE